MSNTSKPLTVFLDNIGRTIIGKVVQETDATLSIENPALVHIQTNTQTNQLQLQILPLFFKEFLQDKNAPTVWDFKKSNVTLSKGMQFAQQFIAQYEQIFQAPPPIQEAPKVVKLFDE